MATASPAKSAPPPPRPKAQTDGRPGFDPYLSAFHEAFAVELGAAIARYRMVGKPRVLDMPCGDGFYTSLLARHISNGELVAADLLPAFLELTRETLRERHPKASVTYVEADAYKLPFDDDSFDMVWCAQSMISLDDPVGALREMRRVLKPRGVVAVLETDEYHHILLPWPTDLEVSIQKAVRTASKRKYGSGSKLAQSRRLRTAFVEAGLSPTRKTTIAADREAPFDKATRAYLIQHFRYLRGFVRPELSPFDAAAFDAFTAEDGPESLLNGPEAELTCLATVSHAKK